MMCFCFGLLDNLIHHLQLIQDSAARLSIKTKKLDHITSIFRSLHWLPIEVHIEFKIILFCRRRSSIVWLVSLNIKQSALLVKESKSRVIEKSAFPVQNIFLRNFELFSIGFCINNIRFIVETLTVVKIHQFFR